MMLWKYTEDILLLQNFVGADDAKLKELFPTRNMNEINARVAWLLKSGHEFKNNVSRH